MAFRQPIRDLAFGVQAHAHNSITTISAGDESQEKLTNFVGTVILTLARLGGKGH